MKLRLCKRLIGLILTLTMVLSLFPVMNVSAAELWPWPLEKAYSISSGYGWRWGNLHAGIDIAAPKGTPVRAVADGNATIYNYGCTGSHLQNYDGYGNYIGCTNKANCKAGAEGNFIIVWHDNGLYTAYKHLSGFNISNGRVSRGQIIGYVGTAGASTGYHLHFEMGRVKYYTNTMNPLDNGYATVSQDRLTIAPTPPPQPPAAPSIRVNASNFAVGKSLTVSWNAVDRATGYDLQIKHASNSAYNKSMSVGGTSTTLNIDNAGTYTVNVKAKNEYGSSGNSNTVTVCAHDPLTVTFSDYDGTVLTTQKVNYGESATAPGSPSREGYTFTSWDKDFSKITANTIIKAQYKINTYTVKFFNRDGESVSTQKIEYCSAAKAPQMPEITGYNFAGWDTEDYKLVKKDISVYPVYIWNNNDLPIKFTTAPIVRRNEMGSGYTADLTLYNYPEITTDGKVVVVLKTSNGKMVASKTEAITLSAGESAKRSIFVPYDGVASKAEVTVVAVIDNDKTGVPISEKAVIDVDLNLEWSNWSITKPNKTDNLTVEERTEYRSRTKSTTTSLSRSMDGWTLYDTTSSWGGWSGWLNYNPGSSSTREVSTQYISPTYKTQHYYSGYTSGSRYHFCPKEGAAYVGGSFWAINSGWLDYELPFSSWGYTQNCAHTGKVYYGKYTSNGGTPYYYDHQTRTVEATSGYTQWRYRDLNYTYHFYKWNDWSDWSPNAVSANSNREVETRKTYRYKSGFSNDMEDKEGKQRTLSGHIDNVKDGKQVTLYVFKGTNTDPTESQLEYVAQSVIKNGGNYSFDYITKEEPNEKTGDFIIMIGVEGAISPFYVDTIKAPVSECTVNFTVDGKTIDTKTVLKGGSVNAPEAPEKVGYTFKEWDSGTTNITDNININAVYESKNYNIIFLDWDNKPIETKSLPYGAALEAPQPPEREGNTFKGWDKILDGKTTVIGNETIVAIYEPNEYNVVFYDSDGSVLSSQNVKYGKAAELPGEPILDGYVFDKWSQAEELMEVKQNMNIYPEFKYEKTAPMPMFSMYQSENSEKNTIMIINDNPNAIIYYTTDGTDPVVEGDALGISIINGATYSDAIEMSYGSVVKAIAYIDGMNTSDVSTCYVIENDGIDLETPNATDTPTEPSEPDNDPTSEPDTETKGAKVKLERKAAEAGSTVEIPITISGNKGFVDLGLELSYDKSAMTLTDIKVNDSVGAAFTGSQSFDVLPYNIGWSCTKNCTFNGTLATLVFMVNENVKNGSYPITISYFKGGDGNYTDGIDVNYDENDNSLGLLYTNGGISIGHIPGDINGDGKLNNKDATALLRKLAGWDIVVNEDALDVNGDGKLNNKDGTTLLRKLAGWDIDIY